MGVELELYVLVILLTIGSSVFAPFEVETPAVRKALKWFIVVGGTVGLYYAVGHLALLFPIAAGRGRISRPLHVVQETRD